MLPSGHFAAGYLVTEALLAVANAHLSSPEHTTVLIVGTLAGIAPDVDLVYFFLRKKMGALKKHESHRLYPTHFPLLWALGSLLIGLIFRSSFGELLALAIFLGSWSHFLLDSVECGVPWLWPFSKNKVTLKETIDEDDPSVGIIRSQWNFITKIYPKTITFYIEVSIILAAIVVFFLHY